MKKIAPVRATINGVMVTAFASRAQLVSHVRHRNTALIAINAEKVIGNDPDMQSFINDNIGFIDGVSVQARFAMNRVFAPKIPGCELWLDLIDQFWRSKRFYLVGATQSVIDETVAQLETTYPGLKIVGYRNGYFEGNESSEAIAREISTLSPDVVFVAMGSPRQERFIQMCQASHPNALYLGVGGSFDIFTGRLNRAPRWLIACGLEWAYRWAREPFARTGRILGLLKFLTRSRLVLLNRTQSPPANPQTVYPHAPSSARQDKA
ncbi:MAG: WecB/TagA/CpsF family glycosyltransferase [Burkholderiaceae bacterium]